jgi:hypothetical protein
MKNRFLHPFLALAAVSLLLQACAGTPKETGAAPKPASQAPAASAAAAEAENMDAAIAEAARGYSRVNKEGKLMFCRRERPSGSNIATNVCITEAELRARVEATKKFNQDSMQQGRRCSQGPACQTS